MSEALELLAQWKRMGVCDWAEQFYILENGKPIALAPWQKRVLTDTMTPGEDGRYAYTTILVSTVKKSGKTELNALATLYYALTTTPYNELIIAANDQEQARSRVFKALSQAVARSPVLREIVHLRKNEAEIKPTGTTIQAIAQDYAGASGARQGWTSWDELWAYRTEFSRRLWGELTPIPTKPSYRLVTTYAGWSGERELLWSLWETAKAGDRLPGPLPIWVNREAGLYALLDRGVEARRMPWQRGEAGERYYREQAQTLRPGEFRRLHLNEWTTGEEAFCTEAQWDALVDPEYIPPGQGVSLVVGVDASVKHDSTAVVSVFESGGRLYLGPFRIWLPSSRHPLDFESTVEAFILELKEQYSLNRVAFDPFQMASTAQRLERAGLRVEEYPQTVPNLVKACESLWDAIKTRRLVVWPGADDLRSHVLAASVKESPRGSRLTKSAGGRKVDAALALAFAVATIGQRGGDRTLHITDNFLRTGRGSPATRLLVPSPELTLDYTIPLGIRAAMQPCSLGKRAPSLQTCYARPCRAAVRCQWASEIWNEHLRDAKQRQVEV